jgi:hypothetical protein
VRLKGQLPQQPPLRHDDEHDDEHNEHYDYDSHYHDFDEHDLDYAHAYGLHPGYHLWSPWESLLCQRQRYRDDLCLRSVLY